MPIFGIGLHIIIAIFFAIHAVRAGRELYWLVILFMFPLFGSIVYFAVVFLPDVRLRRGVRKAGSVIQKSLNPGGELRAARQAFDLTPTAHNQMRVAAALLDAGDIAQAVEQYDACLRGPFAGDAEIGFGAARAKLANGQPQAAIDVLAPLRAKHPNFRAEQVGLLLAGAYAAAGRQQDAGVEYQAAAQRFGSVEARAELAIWAIANGQSALAEKEIAELEHARKHMAKHTRAAHQELFKRLDAASASLR
ncbi:MAG: tetratricopeptide repeat protein [Pseudomonadota bacterium]|nr:tetratricopeptide repeat protein [Pseudomonadota bacterium]